MIDTNAIRNRLIEIAIRGQLTGHIGNLVDVENIISNINNRVNNLLKDKLTKMPPESPMVEDMVFEIPNNWKWVALGNICIMLSRGKSPKYSEEKVIPVFAQKCNQPNGLALDKALFLDMSTIDKWPNYFRLQEGDVVINSTGTGTVGRIGYYLSDTLNNNYDYMLPDSHVTVVRCGDGINSKYLYYALRSRTLQTLIEGQLKGSTNQKELYISSVYALPIPLPPEEEQNRIVNLLDYAHSLLSIIDINQEKYIADIEILKSKIVDAGIQGKLTEQLPEDGNAEDLSQDNLEDTITDSEKEFDIPSSWSWIKLGWAMEIERGGSPRPIKAFITQENNGINWIKIGDVAKDGKYIENTKEKIKPEGEKKSRKVHPGDFLLTNSMSFGRPYISKIEGCIHDGWLLLRNAKGIFDLDYLYWLLSSGYAYNQFSKKATGSTVDNLNKDKVAAAIIPLPPLAEQKRIVEKIESVLDSIK